MMKRHFKVSGRFNGQPWAKVTVEDVGAGRFLIHVRPQRSRKAYTLTLEQVAGIVMVRAAQQEALG